MTLPKQWERWTKKAGLKNSYSSSLQRKYDVLYFTGYGRNWRLNALDYLDISCPIEDFDRWANSRENSIKMEAKTEKEFVDMVLKMAMDSLFEETEESQHA